MIDKKTFIDSINHIIESGVNDIRLGDLYDRIFGETPTVGMKFFVTTSTSAACYQISSIDRGEVKISWIKNGEPMNATYDMFDVIGYLKNGTWKKVDAAASIVHE